MNKKFVSVVILGSISITAFLFWLTNRPLKEAVHSREKYKNPPMLGKYGNRKSIFLQRYDAVKNPKISASAAHNYYIKRKALIREFHGDGQIDNALIGIQGNKDLIMWIGTIQRQEMPEGLPRVASLLTNPDKLV